MRRAGTPPVSPPSRHRGARLLAGNLHINRTTFARAAGRLKGEPEVVSDMQADKRGGAQEPAS